VIWIASHEFPRKSGLDSTVDQLKMLLEHSIKGIDLNCGPDYTTALHKASEFGKLDKVKLLLEYGADPNS
jgi:ankyrin repeat protein